MRNTVSQLLTVEASRGTVVAQRKNGRRRMQGKGPRTPKEDRQFVTALARGLEVLRAFGPGEALANSEIAARTTLPRPTVSRLTYTLTKLGYLIQDPATERYRPGSAV